MTTHTSDFRILLQQGLVLPAHPLALTAERHLDEPRQRNLTRYYLDAGAGGIAVGVHTTQFAIRSAGGELHRQVLQLAAEEATAHETRKGRRVVRVAGVVGPTGQAVREARLAAELGYDAGLLSLGALRNAPISQLLEHCRAVGEVLPLFGFYLQPAVGGRDLPFEFWAGLAELDSLVAIKVAAFDRYRTLDVVRALAESGRDDVALYTGNDDNIVADLLTPFRFRTSRGLVERRFVGGLLGQWAVWTSRAVELLDLIHQAVREPRVPDQHQAELLTDCLATGAALTDANAAIFDAANHFSGCIAGIHEVLRRQGLLAGTWCLDPQEQLSPGQAAAIQRVCTAYPELTDDDFVARWLNVPPP